MSPRERVPEPELQIVEITPAPSKADVDDAFWREEYARHYGPKKTVEEIGNDARKGVDTALN